MGSIVKPRGFRTATNLGRKSQIGRISQGVGIVGCAGPLLLLLISTALFSSSCPAQSSQASATTDIEAAYLYNFGKFVHFPANPSQTPLPFAICTLGQDALRGTLDSLVANESIQGRKVIARKLDSPGDASDCQIIFVGPSEDSRLQNVFATLRDKPVLTVSSIPTFLDRGGMIQFLVEDNRVRFAVNLNAAQQNGLELSSELLKLAVRVDSRPVQERR
jgi:hypothetical protein